jgi:MOSC domain-containing protein YiiM
MSQPSPRTEITARGIVVAVCISSGGVPKQPVDRAEVLADGLIGDGRHHEKHRRNDRAVSIQDLELLEQLAGEGYAVGPGIMGENITVQDLHVQSLAIGDRLRFQDGPVLELASVRKPCYVLDAIHPELKNAVVGRCGFLCRVVEPGTLYPGQIVAAERISAA